MKTLPFPSRTAGAERAVAMLPVAAKVPELGAYSSAEFKYVQEPTEGHVSPPATSTAPLFRSVALCWYRLVLRPAELVSTVSDAVPMIAVYDAVIVLMPLAKALARPLPVTPTALAFEVVHVAEDVMSWVLPSV